MLKQEQSELIKGEVNITEIVLKAVIIILFSVCGVIDYRRQQIPNILVAALAVLGLAYQGFYYETVKALLIPIPLIWLWHRGKMGAGDIKLYAALAVILANPYSLLFSMVISAVTGGIASLVLLLAGKGRKAKIAFAPYIAIGAIVTVIFI